MTRSYGMNGWKCNDVISTTSKYLIVYITPLADFDVGSDGGRQQNEAGRWVIKPQYVA